MKIQELIRINKLINKAISRFKLNLKGLTVLTEAASGYYFVTPIIAARAGAYVIAFSKNSKYGKSKEIIQELKKLAKYFSVETKIKFVEKLTPEIIGSVDIVTNSGYLRPINKNFINLMKPSAVITLMYELWELRKDDIDIDSARKKGVIVAGTNEDAPELKVFDFVKPLILKILFEAGLEIYQNNFLLISNDKFGKLIKEALENSNAIVCQKKPNQKIFINRLPSRIDAIIIANYNSNENIHWIKNGKSIKLIKKQFKEAKEIYFFNGINMKKTFNDLGPLPVINLHTTSLKVAEDVYRTRKEGKNVLELKKNKLIQLTNWEKNPN